MSKLSPKVEEYLETLYRFEEKGQKAKTGEIAAILRVSPASVSEMLKKLAVQGLIHCEPYKGAITPEEKGEEPIIFDVSLRVPGSPGTRFTPYTEYLFGKSVSVGRRIAMEVKKAAEEASLPEIVT